MNEKKPVPTGAKVAAMETLLNYINACPQIIPAGIGLEEFVESLNKAAAKYAEYTHIEPYVEPQKP